MKKIGGDQSHATVPLKRIDQQLQPVLGPWNHTNKKMPFKHLTGFGGKSDLSKSKCYGYMHQNHFLPQDITNALFIVCFMQMRPRTQYTDFIIISTAPSGI